MNIERMYRNYYE